MPSAPEDLTYQDYVDVLNRQWLIVAFVGILGALGGVLLAWYQSPEPVFEATATVSYNPLSGYEAIDTEQRELTDSDLSDQQSFIHSVRTIGTVAQRLGEIPADVPVDEFDEHVEALLRVYRSISLRSNHVKRSGMIQITARGRTSERAAQVANTVAQVYQSENVRELRDRVVSRREFLEEKLRENEEKLNSTQLEYEKFRRQNPLASIEPGVLGFMQDINRSEQIASEVSEKVRETQRQLSLVRSGRPPSDVGLQLIVGAHGTARLQQLSGTYTRLTFERVQLRTELTEQHPAVLQKNEEIESVRQELEGELELILDAYVQQREEEAEKLDQIYERAEAAPEIAMRLSAMSRQVRVYEEVGQSLRRQLQDAILKEGGIKGHVRLISPAAPPPDPANPPAYIQYGLLGLIGGFFAGFALAVLIEASRFTTESLHDIEAELDLPILGINGRAEAETLQAWLPVSRTLKRNSPDWTRTLALSVLLAPRSPFGEAYRTLRANLQWQTRPDRPFISVLATHSEEGATTTAVNLALGLAQSGQRVLLVESDFRNPKIHEIFGVDPIPGLSNLLLGSGDLDEATRGVADFVTGGLSLDDVLLGPGLDHLHVMPAGQLEGNTSELLDSRAFTSLLDRLRDAYDVVVFDAPALQSAADSLVISRTTRAVIVFDPTKTSPDDLRETVNQVRANGADVAGIFVNGMEDAGEADRPDAA